MASARCVTFAFGLRRLTRAWRTNRSSSGTAAAASSTSPAPAERQPRLPRDSDMSLVAYIAGGARGTPGPAGYGVRVEDEAGILIDEFHGFLGTAPNNIAEYNGLLAALRYAREHGQRTVRITCD